jgi:pilus assembly protein CpaF
VSLLRRIEQDNQGSDKPPAWTDKQSFEALKKRIEPNVLADLEPVVGKPTPELRHKIEERFSVVLAEETVELSRTEKYRLFESILVDIIGFGPLEALLLDETIGEIVIVGPKRVYVTRHGVSERERSTVTFEDELHLEQIISRLMPWQPVDDNRPLAHERMANGGYITVMLRPASLSGPVLVIRKFDYKRLTAEYLVQSGTLTAEELHYLQSCVQAKLNILISGDELAGKTTLLNVLCASFGNDELIILVEEPEELSLQQEMVISLVAHPAYVTQHLNMNNLIIHALHMRPERLVIDELHLGQTTAIADADYTRWLAAVRAKTVEEITPPLAPGTDVVVHLRHRRDGTHKVESIFTVQGVANGAFVLADWRPSTASS